MRRSVSYMRSFRRLCIGAAALFGAAEPSAARELEQATSPLFAAQITPYVWGAGLGGTIRPFSFAPEVQVRKSFADVLKDLDGAFFLSGFARYDRFVALGDLSWSSTSRSGRVGPGLPASASLRQTSLTLAGGYRIVSEPGLTVDVLAGARVWHIRARASLALPPTPIAASRNVDFVDPILAARLNLQLAPRWSLIAYADAGGFGAGSRATWQVAATINYQMTDRVFLSGGYRVLAVDYRRGGTRVDVRMQGPIVGATFRF